MLHLLYRGGKGTPRGRGTGGRGRGRGGRGGGRKPLPTSEQLDAELDAYKQVI